MRIRKIRITIIFLLLGITSLALISCSDNKIDPIRADGITPVFSTEPYQMDEDIIIDIHIGIGGENKIYPLDMIDSVRYRIAITNNVDIPFGESDDLLILAEISDYSENKYHWIMDEDGNVTYPYVDQFMIPKEVFTDSSGYFYIGLLDIYLYENSESISGRMYYKYQYLVDDNKVTIVIA